MILSNPIMQSLANEPDFEVTTPADYKKGLDVDVPNEIKSKRDKTTVHTDLGNGKYNAKIHSRAVHYKDENGEYKRIDTRVRKIPKDYRTYEGREYEVHSGVYDAYFSSDFWNYIFSANGGTVQFDAGSWQDHNKVDIVVAVSTSGFKETIELIDETAPTSLTWTLTSADVLTLADNAISVGDAFSISEFSAIDSAGTLLDTVVSLVGSEMTVNVDTTDAVFPVYVDPTINVGSTSQNEWQGENPTYTTARSTYTASYPTYLMFGQEMVPSWRVKRCVVSFSLTSFGGTATAGSLKLRCQTQYGVQNGTMYGISGGSTFTNFSGFSSGGAHTPSYFTEGWSKNNYSNDAWISPALTDDGLYFINYYAGTGSINIMLISSYDISRQASTGGVIRFYSAGSASEPYLDLTYTPTVATATTAAASGISDDGATLNSQVNPNGWSTVTTFEYGETTSYGSTATATQSPLTGTVNQLGSKAITGLDAGTTYHYRVKAVSVAGTVYGSDMTFTTLGSAPTATTQPATGIGENGATLNGTTDSNYLSTTVAFQYGETTGYGSTATATQSPLTGDGNRAVNKAITGLDSGVTYHYRTKAVNSKGTAYGSDVTFDTLSSTVDLAGSIDIESAGSCVLTAGKTEPLSGSIDIESDGSCALTAGKTESLTGSINIESDGSCALTKDNLVLLAGSISIESDGSCALTAGKTEQLAGSIDIESDGSCALTAGNVESLSGLIGIESDGNCVLTAGKTEQLSGSIDIESDGSCALSARINLSGSINIESDGNCALSSPVKLSGVIYICSAGHCYLSNGNIIVINGMATGVR